MPVPNFPDLENGKIDTKKFLEATDDLIDVIEKFGKFFSHITSDMRNNVKKTYSVFHKNKDGNKFLQDLILDEKNQNGDYATDAILWLKRALYFTLRLFELIEIDYQNAIDEDNIEKHVKQAYKESLEPYHNWAVKKLFQLFCKATPTKSKILEFLGVENSENSVKIELRKFCGNLRKNLENLNDFYEKNGLEKNYVVGVSS